jgi:hypothetical protein
MIIVDPIQMSARLWTRRRIAEFCHMASTESVEELLTFAMRIGMRATWLQSEDDHPHFDCTPGLRRKAVAAGAVEVDVKTFVTTMYKPKANLK